MVASPAVRRLTLIVVAVAIASTACLGPEEVGIESCAETYAEAMAAIIEPLTTTSNPGTAALGAAQDVAYERSGDLPGGCAEHLADPAFDAMWRAQLTSFERGLVDRYGFKIAL